MLRQRARTRQPVGLNARDVAACQASGLERMRRQHGGAGTAAHSLGERGLDGEQIERIGIDDQRRMLQRQGPGKTGGRRRRGAESRSDRDRLHGGQIQAFCLTQHQFGVNGIPGRAVLGDETDVDAPGTRHQSGARAEQWRPDHALMAAEYRERSVTPLVGCMTALRQMWQRWCASQ